jgi:hypothetical protein
MADVKCNVGTANAEAHAGPFTPVSETEESSLERCAACGRVVIRVKVSGDAMSLLGFRSLKKSSEDKI